MSETDRIEFSINLVSQCYLAELCLYNLQQEDYDRDCFELMLLRSFCINSMNSNDVIRCNQVAIKFANRIKDLDDDKVYYEWIYNSILIPVIVAINENEYDLAYDLYMDGISILENDLLNKEVNILSFKK